MCSVNNSILGTLTDNSFSEGQKCLTVITPFGTAHNQALAIKHHTYIWYMLVPTTCRLCGDAPEYIDHLLSGCSSIAEQCMSRDMILLLRLFIGLSLGSLALLFQHTFGITSLSLF